MKRHTEELPKRILEIKEELETDLKLSDLNIKEKSLECPATKAKWLSIYYEELKYLDKLKILEEKKLEEYISNHGAVGVPKFKLEDEARKSGDLNKIKKIIKDQGDVVRFLDGVNDIMKSYGWDIKNCISLISLEYQ